MNKSSQTLNSEQYFLLNGRKLSGVSSVSFGYSNSLENSPQLGNPSFGFSLNGPVVANIEVSRFLSENDPFLNYTGSSSFSGAFNYGDKSYFFESGYLGSYSLSCGVGTIPDVSTRIVVFCELKTGESQNEGSSLGEYLFVPSSKSISVSGMNFSESRVKQFSYSLEINRQPIYTIEGGRSAQSVELILPINVSASVDVDASNSFSRSSYSFSSSLENNSVNFTVKNRDLTSTLFNMAVPNAEVISETLSSLSDGQPTKTVQLAGFFS